MEGDKLSELIAIGYPDETTALEAEEEARRLAEELIIQPDAIAAIVRTKDGKYKVTTNHHMVGAGASYGMLWGLLFGVLFRSELIIQPDAIAAIVRTKDGKYKVTTNHHMVGAGASYGMLWGLLFGVLF